MMNEGEAKVLAASIRCLLTDPDAALTRDARLRWEGALTALEVVLGEVAIRAHTNLDIQGL